MLSTTLMQQQRLEIGSSKLSAELQACVEQRDAKGIFTLLRSLQTNAVKQQLVVNMPDGRGGSTPLFTAAWNGDADSLTVLLSCGGKVNWLNHRHNSALDLAIERNHTECVRLLLQAGAHASRRRVVEIRQKMRGIRTVDDEIDAMVAAAEAQQAAAARAALEGFPSILRDPVLNNDMTKLVRVIRDPYV
jgi:hypothetical protein